MAKRNEKSAVLFVLNPRLGLILKGNPGRKGSFLYRGCQGWQWGDVLGFMQVRRGSEGPIGTRGLRRGEFGRNEAVREFDPFGDQGQFFFLALRGGREDDPVIGVLAYRVHIKDGGFPRLEIAGRIVIDRQRKGIGIALQSEGSSGGYRLGKGVEFHDLLGQDLVVLPHLEEIGFPVLRIGNKGRRPSMTAIALFGADLGPRGFLALGILVTAFEKGFRRNGEEGIQDAGDAGNGYLGAITKIGDVLDSGDEAKG